MISQRLDAKLRDYFMNSRVMPTDTYATPYQERPGISSYLKTEIDSSYGYCRSQSGSYTYDFT